MGRQRLILRPLCSIIENDKVKIKRLIDEKHIWAVLGTKGLPKLPYYSNNKENLSANALTSCSLATCFEWCTSPNPELPSEVRIHPVHHSGSSIVKPRKDDPYEGRSTLGCQ
jgi:hypothetical protein